MYFSRAQRAKSRRGSVSAMTEPLEPRWLLAGETPPTPNIDLLVVQPATVAPGATFQMSARLVAGLPEGAVEKVSFYRDSNNSGAWEAGDALLGTDTDFQSDERWAISVTADADWGTTVKVFARAKLVDRDGMTGPWGDPKASQVRIESDQSAGPTISVNDPTVVEGTTGLANLVFQVSLSGPSEQEVTVNYATANGTAKASSDYVATSGTLTFAAGEISKTVTVGVRGDTTAEANETVLLNLSGAVNATIADGQGRGTIKTDDALPNLRPYQPAKWAGKIVTSTVKKTATNAKAIFSNQNIFVDLAIVNNGKGSINRSFRYKLLLNGKVKKIWTETDLPAGYYSYIQDFDLGRLKPGKYTLTVVADSDKVVGETDERDNSYSRVIVVKPRA